MGGDFSSTGLSRYDAPLSLRERHMRRREFITLVGAAAAWPLSVRAQQPAHKLARIGLLQPSLDNPVVARGYPAFLEEMKKSGFSEGQNLTIQFVRLDQDSQSLFAETAELLQKVDLVVSVGAETALQAVLAASRTIPVVIWAINYDPVALGYVHSLVARRQHHWDRVAANRIGGEASGTVETGFSRTNAIGHFLGSDLWRPICRCGTAGKIPQSGCSVAKTGTPAL